MDVGAPIDLPVQTFRAVEVLIAGSNVDGLGRNLRKRTAEKRRRLRREAVVVVQISSTQEAVSVGGFHKLDDIQKGLLQRIPELSSNVGIESIPAEGRVQMQIGSNNEFHGITYTT